MNFRYRSRQKSVSVKIKTKHIRREILKWNISKPFDQDSLEVAEEIIDQFDDEICGKTLKYLADWSVSYLPTDGIPYN